MQNKVLSFICLLDSNRQRIGLINCILEDFFSKSYRKKERRRKKISKKDIFRLEISFKGGYKVYVRIF